MACWTSREVEEGGIKPAWRECWGCGDRGRGFVAFEAVRYGTRKIRNSHLEESVSDRTRRQMNRFDQEVQTSRYSWCPD